MYDADSFRRDTGVSRETYARLTRYADLLRRWQGAINLVSRASLDDLWQRHFLDSAQLLPLLPADAGSVVDVGSGAGFPGLVLAVLRQRDVTLIEANARKCAFLREAACATKTPVTILNSRAEDVDAAALSQAPARVIVARSVAPMDRFLDIVGNLLEPSTYCILLKGVKVESEVTAARRRWRFDLERFPSRSDARGTIVRLSHVAREA